MTSLAKAPRPSEFIYKPRLAPMTIQDELRTLYQHYSLYGLWHWEAGDWCSEDGFTTEEECYADFEQFIATLED